MAREKFGDNRVRQTWWGGGMGLGGERKRERERRRAQEREKERCNGREKRE